MVPSQKKPQYKNTFFDNHAKKKLKKHGSGLISESIFNAKRKEEEEKRKTPTKQAGPLKMLTKQCVWCSKNSHQTGAIKPLSAKKKRGGERDRSQVPHLVPSARFLCLWDINNNSKITQKGKRDVEGNVKNCLSVAQR